MYKIVLENRYGIKFPTADRIWFAILAIIIIPLAFFVYKGIQKTSEKKSYYCVVVHKYQDQLADKSGDTYRLEKKLIVKFDSLDEKKDFVVTADTYLSVKEGDRVSFKMSNDEMNKVSHWIGSLSGVGIILLLINSIALLVKFYEWISHIYNTYTIKLVRVPSAWTIRQRKKVDPYGEEVWDDKQWWFANRKRK